LFVVHKRFRGGSSVRSIEVKPRCLEPTMDWWAGGLLWEWDSGCLDMRLAQIEALKKLFVDKFSSSQSKVNRMSLEYQGEIYNTRIDRCEAWMKNAFLLKTFSEFKKQTPLTHLSPHSFGSVIAGYIHLSKSVVTHSSLLPPNWSRLRRFLSLCWNNQVRCPTRTVLHISGCILSSIRKAEHRSQNTPLFPCFHLSSFIIVTHLLPRRMDDFLFTWCDTRDKGSLMFAKQPLFDLICTIEHGYAKLLTLSNVSKCAGSSD